MSCIKCPKSNCTACKNSIKPPKNKKKKTIETSCYTCSKHYTSLCPNNAIFIYIDVQPCIDQSAWEPRRV